MKGKGISSAVVAVILIAIIVPTVIGLALYAGYLTTLAMPAVAVTYDGEFDDAYVASEYGFYIDGVEQTDCNITSDVLGGSAYSACIYNTSAPGFIANQSTRDWEFDIVVDIDGPVEKMDIDLALQNTGTLQAAADVIIKNCALYKYEKGALLGRPVKQFEIDDNNYQVDDSTGPLMGDEYVIKITLHTKAIDPAAASGDDIFKLDLDLTTDGDTDAARILLESH